MLVATELGKASAFHFTGQSYTISDRWLRGPINKQSNLSLHSGVVT